MATSLENFPDFLLKYKDRIEKGSMETVLIKAFSLQNGEKTMLTQSKFRGLPYLPKDMDYPLDNDGNPMLLYAQINFAEVPPIQDYPESGILQYFHKAPFWDSDPDDNVIRFHKDTSQEPRTDFSFLDLPEDNESPIQCEHKLIFTLKTEYGGSIYDYFTMLLFYDKEPEAGARINLDALYTFRESLTDNEKALFDDFFSANGHKIGGFGSFPNHYRDMDTYSKNRDDDDLLLLQIDSDSNIGIEYEEEKISWGDSGVAHIFIKRGDLKRKNFEEANFYWSCY